jgi:uncharacterized protein
MTNENVELMRKGYEAFEKGDLDTIREQFSPDIVWHSGGDNALTGDYKGIDEVFGLFAKLFEMTGGTFKQDVHDILANDVHAVVLSHATASRPDGRTLDGDQVAVFHVDGGRATEVWIVPQDADKANAFFS